MKFLIFVTYILCLVQFIDCRRFRVVIDENILPYIPDPSVIPITEIFDNHVSIEQIDDDNFVVGGYLLALKTFNDKLLMRVDVSSSYLYQSKWIEGLFRITFPDICSSYVDPKQLFHNITKLFTRDVCPQKKGVIWRIETQSLNLVYDLPQSTPAGLWRAYMLITQGLPRFETFKSGFGLEIELVPMN